MIKFPKYYIMLLTSIFPDAKKVYDEQLLFQAAHLNNTIKIVNYKLNNVN